MLRQRMSAILMLLALLLYAIAAPLLTRFVDQTGVFGALFVVPLVMATRQKGRRTGLWMAALGVVLNAIVWVSLGNAFETIRHTPASAIVGLLGECLAFALVVIVLDKFFFVNKELAQRSVDAAEVKDRLQASEKRYEELVELAPESILVVADRRIRFFNHRLIENSGYTHEELLGLDFTTLVYKDDLQAALERHKARMKGDTPPISTVRYVRKGGEVRWADVTGAKISWEGVPAVLYFLTDITDVKVLEAQFVQAQKMEAIGRLAGGVAHDFNNLLQVIMGFTEVMRRHAGENQTLGRDIGVVEDTARKAASLTQQLLAFSRKQSLQPQLIDLRDVVNQSVRMLKSILGEDINIKVQEAAEPCQVYADAGEMNQIIMNLAVNARDAMPNGGTLGISLSAAGDKVDLSVTDTGSGMDKAVLSHIFEPFYTTKEPGKGTGLGLSTVYGIVKRSNGDIDVESQPGTGTRLTITLPRLRGVATKTARQTDAASETGSGYVLLVEDSDDVRSAVRSMLASGGYRVAEASCGKEALETFRNANGGFDLLLTDLVMPEMNGAQVADEVRRLNPKIAVVFMTGHADAKITDSVGDRTLIHKPFESPVLLKALKQALRHGPSRD